LNLRSSASFGFLLLGPLLDEVVFVVFLDVLSSLLHVQDLVLVMVLVLLVLVVVWVLALVVGIVGLSVFVSGHTRDGSNSDVFVQKFLGTEVVHEVLGCDIASLVFVLFGDDLTQLLGHSLTNLLENKGQRLVLPVSSDVLTKVDVNFLGDSTCPSLDLISNKVNFLAKLVALLLVFAVRSDLLVQILDLRRENLATSIIVLLFVLLVGDLELVEFLSPDLMVFSEVFNFTLVFRDSDEQLRVSLFSGEESVNNLIDIGQVGGSSDLLESILDVSVVAHLVLHLFLKEG